MRTILGGLALFLTGAGVGFLSTRFWRSGASKVDSRTDATTQLLTTGAFTDEATRMLVLAKRHKRPVAAAYIDLDDFKAVNDTLGRAAGDAVLRRTAEVLQYTLRKTDLIARLQADEFAVLLPETDREGATFLLERLCLALAETHTERTAPVTASVGAVACDADPPSIENLLKRAEALMRAAKAAGKNEMRVESV
jgi:diguanylate cyclase (GGDEF)-like protein